jgi:hypothetical protein
VPCRWACRRLTVHLQCTDFNARVSTGGPPGPARREQTATACTSCIPVHPHDHPDTILIITGDVTDLLPSWEGAGVPVPRRARVLLAARRQRTVQRQRSMVIHQVGEMHYY